MRLLVIAALLATPAAAHDWYPASCCHDRDCYSLSPDEYEITGEGYRIVATGEIIAFGRERPSPDGLFHRCSWSGNRARPTIGMGSPVQGPCFWAPVGF